MQREIRLTADGSHTVAIPGMNVTYHSHFGAIGESMHVYINAGLQPFLHQPTGDPLTVFEMGFGTGLNVLLTLQQATNNKHHIHYTAVELYPLSHEEILLLNYGRQLDMQEAFLQLHNCDWEKDVCINEYFTLKKIKASLPEINMTNGINCIYFDAFSPTSQPELWTQEIFEKMYNALLPGGALVTYCSKSVVRHAMEAAGFRVEKIPGPWGKREMVRAGRGN